MSIIFDKSYLQSIGIDKNSLICDQIYQSILDDVFNAAVSGKTSYTYDLILNTIPKERVFPDFSAPPMHPMMRDMIPRNNTPNSKVPTIRLPLIISIDDLVSGLQAKFPGCKVSFFGDAISVAPNPEDHVALHEIMQQYRQGNYVPKRGVVIDWS